MTTGNQGSESPQKKDDKVLTAQPQVVEYTRGRDGKLIATPLTIPPSTKKDIEKFVASKMAAGQDLDIPKAGIANVLVACKLPRHIKGRLLYLTDRPVLVSPTVAPRVGANVTLDQLTQSLKGLEFIVTTK